MRRRESGGRGKGRKTIYLQQGTVSAIVLIIGTMNFN